MRAFLLAGVTAVALLAGCHPGATKKSETAAADARAKAAGFVPPATQSPKPIPGQGNATPLNAYVGKYPRDTVDGVTFFDRTEVGNALIAAVGDEKVRHLINGAAGVQTPIFRQGERIGAWGCEPHNCGDHNWAFLVQPDGQAGEACYHTAAMGDASRWYSGGAPVTRPGACPST